MTLTAAAFDRTVDLRQQVDDGQVAEVVELVGGLLGLGHAEHVE
jgi:hypothetical protein